MTSIFIQGADKKEKRSPIRTSPDKRFPWGTRRQVLDNIGFSWRIQESQDELHARFLKELKEYKDNFGDCDVPYKYPENQWLANRAAYLRKQHKANDTTFLTTKRREELNNIGFRYRTAYQSAKIEDHMVNVRKLKEFKRKHGHLFLPFPTVTKNLDLKKLHIWSLHVRDLMENDNLPQEVEAALDDIGFNFDPYTHFQDEERMEAHFIYDLKMRSEKDPNFVLSWDTLNKVINTTFKGYHKKPDAVLLFSVSGRQYMIVLEIDEHRHHPRFDKKKPQYTVELEQQRQNWLWVMAKEMECEGMHVIRVNTAERYRPAEKQQDLVYDLLKTIHNNYSETSPNAIKGPFITMVDYPRWHDHFIANKRRMFAAGKFDENKLPNKNNFHDNWNGSVFPLWRKMNVAYSGEEMGE